MSAAKSMAISATRVWKSIRVLFVDLELGWDVTENWNVTLGGSNIFDEYPDKVRSGGRYANRESQGLLYPRRAVTGYEGGSWYLRASYNF